MKKALLLQPDPIANCHSSKILSLALLPFHASLAGSVAESFWHVITPSMSLLFHFAKTVIANVNFYGAAIEGKCMQYSRSICIRISSGKDMDVSDT